MNPLLQDLKKNYTGASFVSPFEENRLQKGTQNGGTKKTGTDGQTDRRTAPSMPLNVIDYVQPR